MKYFVFYFMKFGFFTTEQGKKNHDAILFSLFHAVPEERAI
jgi:hypothetical protein